MRKIDLKRFRIFFALSFLIFASIIVKADKVDDVVLFRMSERKIPGAAVVVIKDGKVIKQKGYGLASIEFNVPVTNESVFEIGSVSKQMTAAGIMLLVQDGKVKLDDKISAYLPNTPEIWKDVTVRHLLTHTSGIKSYTSLNGFELSRRVTMEGFIKQLSPHPLEFVPGEKSVYSNSGYNLLAYIIQAVGEKPFMQFMQERIFTPLRMTKTADRDPRFIIPQRVTGYEWRNENYFGRDGNLTDLMGAGSIVSTISDMVKWNAALNSNTLFTENSKKELWTQFTFNNGERSLYGLGWRISDVRGRKLIGHTGQTAGFGAAIFRYVEDGIAVIVLTNLGELGMGSLIANDVAKLYISDLSIKNMKKISIDKKNNFDQISRSFISVTADKIDANEFTSDFVRIFTTDRFKIIVRRAAAYGPITSTYPVSEEIIENTRVFKIVATSRSRIMLWRVEQNMDGKISNIVLEEDE